MDAIKKYSDSVEVLFDLNKNKMPEDVKFYFENVFNKINSAEYVSGVSPEEVITLVDEFDYVFKYGGLGDICLTELLSHLQLNIKKHKYKDYITKYGTIQKICKHCGYIKEDNDYRRKLNLKRKNNE